MHIQKFHARLYLLVRYSNRQTFQRVPSADHLWLKGVLHLQHKLNF